MIKIIVFMIIAHVKFFHYFLQSVAHSINLYFVRECVVYFEPKNDYLSYYTVFSKVISGLLRRTLS